MNARISHALLQCVFVSSTVYFEMLNSYNKALAISVVHGEATCKKPPSDTDGLSRFAIWETTNEQVCLCSYL